MSSNEPNIDRALNQEFDLKKRLVFADDALILGVDQQLKPQILSRPEQHQDFTGLKVIAFESKQKLCSDLKPVAEQALSNMLEMSRRFIRQYNPRLAGSMRESRLINGLSEQLLEITLGLDQIEPLSETEVTAAVSKFSKILQKMPAYLQRHVAERCFFLFARHADQGLECFGGSPKTNGLSLGQGLMILSNPDKLEAKSLLEELTHDLDERLQFTTGENLQRLLSAFTEQLSNREFIRVYSLLSKKNYPAYPFMEKILVGDLEKLEHAEKHLLGAELLADLEKITCLWEEVYKPHLAEIHAYGETKAKEIDLPIVKELADDTFEDPYYSAIFSAQTAEDLISGLFSDDLLLLLEEYRHLAAGTV